MAEQNNPMSSESSSLPEIQRLIADAIEALAEEDNIPAEALEQLKQVDKLIGSKAKNAMRELDVETRIHHVRQGAFSKNDIPCLLKDPDARVRMELARSASIGRDEIFTLAHDPDPNVRLCIAERKGASASALSRETLDVLSHDEDPRIRTAVARHTKTSTQTLQTLVQDSSPSVREALFLRAPIPPELADELMKASSHDFLLKAATNPRTAPGLLNRLATCQFTDVRLAISKRNTLPDNIIRPALSSLSRDSDAAIRLEVAKSTRIPRDAAVSLAQDPDRSVRIALANNEALPAEAQAVLAQDEDAEIRLKMAEAESLPDNAVSLLARDSSHAIRAAIAKRKTLPSMAKVVLAQDPDPDIRMSIVKCEDLPLEAFAVLACDPDEDIRTILVDRQECTKASRDIYNRMLATNMHLNIRPREQTDDAVPECALEAKTGSEFADAFMQLDSNLENMQDEERMLLARNANNIRILSRLANDPNSEVSKAAQNNIAWKAFRAVERICREGIPGSAPKGMPGPSEPIACREETLIDYALENPRIPKALLARIAEYDEWDDVRGRNASPFAQTVYNNPSLSFNDVNELGSLATTNLDIAYGIALNPTAPTEILDKIAHANLEKAAGHDEDHDIYYFDEELIRKIKRAIIDNPSSSFETLHYLDPSAFAKPASSIKEVADNHNSFESDEEEESLYPGNFAKGINAAIEDGPSSPDFRQEASSPDTPDETLWELAKCIDAYANLAARSQLLQRAGFHDEKSIRNAAELPDFAKNLIDCREILGGFPWDILPSLDDFWVSALTEIHPYFMRPLAHDINSQIRMRALASLGYPEDELALCEYDPDPHVRAIVARMTADAGILERLSASQDPIVREGAARNPLHQNPVLLRRLAADPCIKIREAVAENQSCPADILDTLSQNDEICVRLACIANPACPEESWLNAVRSIPRAQWEDLVRSETIPSERLLYLTLDLLKETGYASECNVKDLDTFGIFDQPE